VGLTYRLDMHRYKGKAYIIERVKSTVQEEIILYINYLVRGFQLVLRTATISGRFQGEKVVVYLS